MTKWNLAQEAALKAMIDGNPGLSEYYWSAALGAARDFGMSDRRLIESLAGLADAQECQHKLSEAERNYRTAIDLSARQLGAQHVETAKLKNLLAGILFKMAKYNRAAQLCEESLKVFDLEYGPEHNDVGSLCINLASCYRVLRDYAKAEPMYKRALAIKTRLLGPNHPAVIELLEACAFTLEKNHKAEEANVLKQCVQSFRSGHWAGTLV